MGAGRTTEGAVEYFFFQIGHGPQALRRVGRAPEGVGCYPQQPRDMQQAGIDRPDLIEAQDIGGGFG
jgi:hypothetical protein